MEKRKEDISIDHISMENLPDYDLDNNTKRIIEAHGEVSFLRRVIKLIRKHVRLNVNLSTGQITVTIAGVVVADRNINK